MQPIEFCRLALRLASPGTSQPSWRSAISRAYYAVYHETNDLFRAAGLSLPSKGIPHEFTGGLLATSKGAELQKIHILFYQLLKLRRAADYDLEQDTMTDWQQPLAYVSKARDIIELITTIKADKGILAAIQSELAGHAHRTVYGSGERGQ